MAFPLSAPLLRPFHPPERKYRVGLCADRFHFSFMDNQKKYFSCIKLFLSIFSIPIPICSGIGVGAGIAIVAGVALTEGPCMDMI